MTTHRILVTDPLHQAGLDLLDATQGVDIHLLSEEERPRLADLLGGFDAVVVRSGTRLTADLLRCGERLKVIARAGIGVDNIDVATATELGILVVNSPTANLLSATEHTFAMLLALARNIPAADRSMRAGEWNRKGERPPPMKMAFGSGRSASGLPSGPSRSAWKCSPRIRSSIRLSASDSRSSCWIWRR